MAAITALPFRLMCRQQGAGLVITEQINATQICRNSDPFTNNGFFTIKTIPDEKPVGVQLFGTDKQEFARAVEIVGKDFDLVNINCGCPSHKEVSIGAGAALLREPQKIAGIVEAIKGVTDRPVTVKMRLGWSGNNSVKIAKLLERAGCDAIMLHGRSGEQKYTGKADWGSIKRVVEAVSIPVVANGDVKCGRDAEEILGQTGARFGMVGRAAMANPFIFREINEWIGRGVEWKPTPAEKVGGFFDYLAICERLEMVKLTDLKIKAVQFTKGIDFTKPTRVKLQGAKSIDGIRDALGDLRDSMERN